MRLSEVLPPCTCVAASGTWCVLLRSWRTNSLSSPCRPHQLPHPTLTAFLKPEEHFLDQSKLCWVRKQERSVQSGNKSSSFHKTGLTVFLPLDHCFLLVPALFSGLIQVVLVRKGCGKMDLEARSEESGPLGRLENRILCRPLLGKLGSRAHLH